MTETSKKEVRFGAESIHNNSASIGASDIEQLWYDRAFFEAKIQNLRVISEAEDNDCSCLTAESRLRRYNHARSVLSLQAEMNDMHLTDATGLRAFASALSKTDARRARERATRGATDAYQVYDQSTEWMKGISAKDYVGQSSRKSSRVGCNSKNESLMRKAINKEALRIVWAL